MDITKTRIHYVYGLHYPDGQLFYVGKGQRGRMYQHVSQARKGVCVNKYLQNTIRKIERNGGKVLYKKFFNELEECDALQKERELIAQHGRKATNTGKLVNFTDGGEGTSGYKHTDESRKAMSERAKGNTNRLGHKLSPEQIKGMSERMKGKPGLRIGKKHTEESRAKIRTARAKQISPMKGRKHSKATKEKISQAKTGVPSGRKGIPRTDGHIKVINDKWRGSKQTPEALALISAASKARWQDPVYVEKVLAARAAARSMKKMEASCQ